MRLVNPTESLDEELGYENTIRFLKNSGFDAIDMSFVGMFNPDSVNQVWCHDGYADYARKLRDLAAAEGICFLQAHAPFPSYKLHDEVYNRDVYQWIIRSMEISSILGIPRIVVHPIQHLPYRKNRERLFEMSVEFFRSLIPYCEKYHIQVCCENMWDWDNKREIITDSVCSRPEEFVALLETINSPWIVACLDVGHCALTGVDPADAIRALGKKHLKALHIHDVDYRHDCHTMPYLENLDWQSITQALHEIGYEEEWTFEANCLFEHMPVELWEPAGKLLAETGRYLIAQTAGASADHQ